MFVITVTSIRVCMDLFEMDPHLTKLLLQSRNNLGLDQCS